MTEHIEARAAHAFKAPRERVFDAWLDADLVRRWMQASLKRMALPGDIRRVEIDAREGGRFTFSDMRDDGEAVHWGTYLEFDRPHKLAFTWFMGEEQEQHETSRVTLIVEPEDDGGSLATILHEVDAKYAEFIPQVENSWAIMLAEVDALLD